MADPGSKAALEALRRERRREERHQSRAGTTYQRFLDALQAEASLDRPNAERAAFSVLCALEQRLYSQEAEDLEAQLPATLRALLQRCERHEGPPPTRFGRDELLAMVAEDLGLGGRDEAEPVVRAVFRTVRARISEGEADDVAQQLPADLRALWARPS